MRVAKPPVTTRQRDAADSLAGVLADFEPPDLNPPPPTPGPIPLVKTAPPAPPSKSASGNAPSFSDLDPL